MKNYSLLLSLLFTRKNGGDFLYVARFSDFGINLKVGFDRIFSKRFKLELNPFNPSQ